ncbi:hypothetical protein MKQ68_22090 [Chitinophaga horti]|uniref:Uncharacterized protein n=1 Tax=Chitinophaga horti TaxID=2920382 RepID=A0ABY6J392_9BACT|nr:hypothetical protein [Chitinophaga horti]UYQ92774.1 hypothetical protein MKQ68_22090 [Chitinophaga horti]
MKKLLSLCVLALLVLCQPGFAQKKKTPVKKKKTYKPVAAKKPAAPPIQYDALAAYIKVWGLVKYNHPAVAGDKLDADSVFLSNLYTVERVTTRAQFNVAMNKMLASLADSQLVSTTPTSDSWITRNTLFDDPLRAQLLAIAGNPPPVQATREKVSDQLESVLFYQDIQYPNMPFQMLSLARYWNSVHYSFSNDSQHWDTVLTQFVPGFYKARTEADVEQLMRNVMAASDQAHSANFNSRSTGSIPPSLKRKRVSGERGFSPEFVEEYRNKRRFRQLLDVAVITPPSGSGLISSKNLKSDWQFAV